MAASTIFGGGLDKSNPNNDIKVTCPPDDTVSCLEFSPSKIPHTYLIAGGWDNMVRCWEIEKMTLGLTQTVPKAFQSMQGPILDVCWSDDGSKVFMASCDKTVGAWDLVSNQQIQVAQHDAPVKTCHWIKAPNYTALMTTSWDKTIKFWDIRTPHPIHSIDLPDKSYCVDMEYPVAVVGTANRKLMICQLDTTPSLLKAMEPHRLVKPYQLRSVAIFKNDNLPTGFAVANVASRSAIQYFNDEENLKKSFSFRCHHDVGQVPDNVFAIHGLKYHPVHGTLASVGSDGRYCFWDHYNKVALKKSEPMGLPITTCAFDGHGQFFAYAVGYDWSKGHSFQNLYKNTQPQIFLHLSMDDCKPKTT